jgi:hypothetical protein
MLPIVAAAAASLIVPATVAADRPGTAQPAHVTLHLGDIVTVSGAPVGCIARKLDGLRVVDCRKVGPHAGTYGAVVSGRGVLVLRFRNEGVAKVVFSARQDSTRTRTCR